MYSVTGSTVQRDFGQWKRSHETKQVTSFEKIYGACDNYNICFEIVHTLYITCPILYDISVKSTRERLQCTKGRARIRIKYSTKTSANFSMFQFHLDELRIAIANVVDTRATKSPSDTDYLQPRQFEWPHVYPGSVDGCQVLGTRLALIM